MNWPKTDERTIDTLRSQAYHEAGHAVMCFLLGLDVPKVMFRPRPVDGATCNYREEPPRGPQSRETTENRIMVRMAGVIVERHHQHA
jgi:ATP-dependent Zn protease